MGGGEGPRKKEGRVKTKSRAAPLGVGARTQDLLRARRESLAARHRGGLSLSMPIYLYHMHPVLEIVSVKFCMI